MTQRADRKTARAVPVPVLDALGEDLTTLETVADLLGMAGESANPDPRTLHGLALTIRGACDRMRGVLEERRGRDGT